MERLFYATHKGPHVTRLVAAVVFAAVRAAMFATWATMFTTEVALLAAITMFATLLAAVTMFATLLATVTTITAFATVFITTAVLVIAVFVVFVLVFVVMAFCVRSNRHSNTQSSKQKKSFFHREQYFHSMRLAPHLAVRVKNDARKELRQNKGSQTYIMLI
ncbi:hypothetical protein [Acetobacter oryzifermentans]|uniref:hypothetical protein n=1 Tax=Acetobacter oryzifermentans TaxID=1633874 RepID=UPI0012FF3FA0|nr:hypothetical protein [Acetobacter oryzifermentans]